MNFSIELFEALERLTPSLTGSGCITIGSFKESFKAPLDFWSVNDYKLHWTGSIDFLISSHQDSCLITAMHDPETANYIEWWLLYPRGNTVMIQNQILLLNSLSVPFDVRRPYIHVPSRVTVNDEGVAISEWVTTLDDLIAYRSKHP